MSRIGLFGGTFNPIHFGHLDVAENVLEKLRLDQVLFIPAGDPPHKAEEKMPSAEHRLEMTRLALIGRPRFDLSDLEIRRSGKSYSIQTVSELKKRHPQDPLFFIIGMDAFFYLPTWKEAERLLTLCHFVVVSRPGASFSKVPRFGPLKGVDSEQLEKLDRGEIDLYQLPTGPETSVYFLSIPPTQISASEIRMKVASQKEAKNLLPESVESYIIKNKLYR